MTNEKTREKLAELEHDQWAHWTRHMLDVLGLIEDDIEWHRRDQTDRYHLTMREKLTDEQRRCVDRWRRQIATPYAALSETEKDSDREWADKVLKVFEAAPEVKS